MFTFKNIFAPLAVAMLLAAPAMAEPVVVTPLASVTTTASGQKIVLPQGDARVIASLYVIAPGAKLPLHKHPYPRCAYVLAGHLRVTDTDTGQKFDYKQGDFIVEVINQWHFAENTGPGEVRLLVIDTVPAAETGNTVKAKPAE